MSIWPRWGSCWRTVGGAEFCSRCSLARRCYDHISGRLGVAITDALREHGLLEGPDSEPDLANVSDDRLSGRIRDDVDYRVTEAGHDALAALGVVLPPKL